MTGWTIEQYLDAPALEVDWLLAIDDAVNEGKARKAAVEAARQRRGR